MTNSIDHYIALLDHKERNALDNPDRLFAISYLRGHIDLISATDQIDDPLCQLRSQISAAFEVDQLCEDDKKLIVKELDALTNQEE